MGFLIVSILVAAATATSTYLVSGSLMLAFFAYAAAGSLALISALIAEAFVPGDLED